MIWNLTSCLLPALSLLGCLFAASPCIAEPVTVANGSTNLTVWVETSAGRVRQSPGSSLTWDGSPGDVASYGTNASFIGSWVIQNAHSYGVFLGEDGAVQVVDQSSFHTKWFFLGFSFMFCIGLMGLSARWTKNLVGGGHNE